MIAGQGVGALNKEGWNPLRNYDIYIHTNLPVNAIVRAEIAKARKCF